MLNRKLGKGPKGYQNLPHYSQLKRVPFTNLPAKVDWLKGMPVDLGMMCNDKYGCCTIAALHHARQIWTYNVSGQILTDLDNDVLLDYERLCGYVLGQPLTDKGGLLSEVLKGSVKYGITTEAGPDLPIGFVEVDPRVLHDIKEVIAFGGIAYLGLTIPKAWTESSAGDTWDVVSSPIEGGHCVIATGYDERGITVISWGQRFKLTEMAFARYCDEAYCIIDRNWANIKNTTPGGLNLDQLEQLMMDIKKC